MSVERKFYWACGKCGSAGLYRDDDFQAGDCSIVCLICGERYYGDVGVSAKRCDRIGGIGRGLRAGETTFNRKRPALAQSGVCSA